jgi:hypothetical protein
MYRWIEATRIAADSPLWLVAQVNPLDRRLAIVDAAPDPRIDHIMHLVTTRS